MARLREKPLSLIRHCPPVDLVIRAITLVGAPRGDRLLDKFTLLCITGKLRKKMGNNFNTSLFF